MDYRLYFIEDKEWNDRKVELIQYFSTLEYKHSIVSSLGLQRKYSGYFALIPENLDIDAHLLQYPLTDYMFVEDNTGHIRSVTKSGSLSSSLYFDKDRLIYIIGLISSIPARNKDSITEDGFVSINSTLIRNAFKDYLSYLDYLIRTGILCTDGQYIQGEKSKGYKFTDEFIDMPLVRYYYYSAFQQGAIVESIPQEIYSEEVNRFVQNPVFQFPYLSYWYSTKKLHIDQHAAMSYAFVTKEDKFNRGMEYWDINRDKSRGNYIRKKYPRTQYHAAVYNINSIAIGDYKVSIDGNVHRLHSVITNIQKNYRNFLSYDGKELVAIDVSNSQPYLLCLLLNPQFWDKNSNISLNIGMLHQNVQNLFSDIHLDEIKGYLSTLNWADDTTLNSYIQNASEGTVYEFMQQIVNNKEHVNLERKDIKIMILTTFFSKNSYIPSFKRYFRSSFPQIYRLIEKVKKINHAALACLLQNIESEIILHRCCKRIWEEGNQLIPVFTVHDSIATIEEYNNFVQQVLQEELYNAVGIFPHLKIEEWRQ